MHPKCALNDDCSAIALSEQQNELYQLWWQEIKQIHQIQWSNELDKLVVRVVANVLQVLFDLEGVVFVDHPVPAARAALEAQLLKVVNESAQLVASDLRTTTK